MMQANLNGDNHMTEAIKPMLLVMAGGTGGHIFPGLAVADELKAQSWNIHWLGTPERMEARIVPEHGYDISFINMSGVRHKGLITRLATPLKLLKAIWQAHKILKQIKPDVVIGMGGYASAPGGIAAWLNNIPLLVHEQNAAAGLTNRILSRFATKVCCAFPKAFSPSIDVDVVGNPLRASIGHIKKESETIDLTKHETIANSKRNVLVVGGSLGAQVLNQTLPQSIKVLNDTFGGISVWHQTGKNNQEKVIKEYENIIIGANSTIKVDEFITDMATAYKWADIVICRAGALTVSELAMSATPAIFVPLPHAVDDHQTKNAQYLVSRGAARLLPQNEFDEHNLTSLITELFDDSKILTIMAAAAFDAADGEATTKVASLCQQLLSKNKTVNTALRSNKKEMK
jgi:UDP-N-acetylglucosamine--N-acetylmuramyl-(pentapeptide) pyrophosphoryl-undecaprenol N-acetylglucosamine transferase